ncbi:MAG: DUF465 domain-containing protein [Sulfuricella denitrificans]|nr:DUF465 domain-containing protein [Sulfuricella denitrificans]
MLEYHELTKEFPELKDKIHDMKVGNAHFAKLFDEYHLLDRDILRIEQELEPASDVRAEDLKKKRLALKTTLYQMLQD